MNSIQGFSVEVAERKDLWKVIQYLQDQVMKNGFGGCSFWYNMDMIFLIYRQKELFVAKTEGEVVGLRMHRRQIRRNLRSVFVRSVRWEKGKRHRKKDAQRSNFKDGGETKTIQRGRTKKRKSSATFQLRGILGKTRIRQGRR